MRVLQKNLGIGRESQSKPSRKRGKKVTPGQIITTLQNQDKENTEPIPGPSGQSKIVCQDRDSEESEQEEIHCGKPTARKKQPKESKGKKFRKS